MLKCPACGEFTLHPKRKELGYHGRKVDIELINFDKDDVAISQSLKERVQQVLDDDEDDTLDMFDPDKKTPRIQGIDY